MSYIEFITISKKMQKINQQIEKASQTDVSMLITGEKGTGKTACARFVHEKSNRTGSAFIHTAANEITTDNMDLLFDSANGGTLYIDEAQGLSAKCQQKLLDKISQEKNLFRLITSSTGQLEHAVKRKEFIPELYYLLCVMNIRLLSLRERKEDIPLLINEFIKKLNGENAANKQVSDEVIKLLSARSWHGNIYELENSIQYAFQRAKNNIILIQDLPVWSTVSYYTSHSGESLYDELLRISKELVISAEQIKTFNVYKDFKQLVFPPLLSAAMQATENNISHAAILLGITRNTLKKMLRDYEIEK